MHPARLAAIAFVVLCAGTGPAHADWVVSGFLGAAATRDVTLRIDQPVRATAFAISAARFTGRSFESPVYYGYRVMWAGRSGARIGVEGELIHLKAYLDTTRPAAVTGTLDGAPVNRTVTIGDLVQRFSVSHGLNLLFVNIVLRQPLGGRGRVETRRLLVAVRVGAGPTIPHTESTIGGRTQEQYEWGRVAGQAAAGLEYRFARRASAIVEYKVTGTRERLSVAEGTASGTFVSQHGVGGLAWRF
jgi:hypothetical protein